MENLELELKELVISTLNLADTKPQDINTAAPLFGDGLGLDSIDALELGVALKKKYQVKLDVETDDVKKHFHSIQSLANYISQSK